MKDLCAPLLVAMFEAIEVIALRELGQSFRAKVKTIVTDESMTELAGAREFFGVILHFFCWVSDVCIVWVVCHRVLATPFTYSLTHSGLMHSTPMSYIALSHLVFSLSPPPMHPHCIAQFHSKAANDRIFSTNTSSLSKSDIDARRLLESLMNLSLIHI